MIRPFECIMGTNLNSVWLEGTLLAEPVSNEIDPPTFRFPIEAPEPHEAASVFLVEADDAAFDGCRPRLCRGREVRIIGRLHQRRWVDNDGFLQKEVKIIGEMVEPLGVPL